LLTILTVNFQQILLILYQLQEIRDVLEPARIATENLSKSSINVLEGEGILKFLLNEIEEQKSKRSGYLAINFKEALHLRLDARRDKLFQSLVLYLSNHDSLKSSHPLLLVSKSQVVKFGIEMIKRLYPTEADEVLIPIDSVSKEAFSLQEKCDLMVGSVRDLQSSQCQITGDKFKKEFDYFERHHMHGPLMKKLFKAVLSAQPTSTQSERNFSLAASIVTKKRARLSSENLNACSFLKSYFANIIE
jgi:hAT family C-terminal dimerisation region